MYFQYVSGLHHLGAERRETLTNLRLHDQQEGSIAGRIMVPRDTTYTVAEQEDVCNAFISVRFPFIQCFSNSIPPSQEEKTKKDDCARSLIQSLTH